MKNIYLYSIILVSCGLTGCISPQYKKDYAETRNAISVENGLPQIATGAVAMKKVLEDNNQQIGLYMDTLTLTTSLNANGEKGTKLGMSADPLDITSLSKSIFKAEGSQETKYSDLRGSVLTINFKSVNQYNLERLDKIKGLLEASAKADPKKAEQVGVTKKVIEDAIKDTGSPEGVFMHGGPTQ